MPVTPRGAGAPWAALFCCGSVLPLPWDKVVMMSVGI